MFSVRRLRDFFCVWNIRPAGTVLWFCRLLALLSIGNLLTGCAAICPSSQNLRQQVTSCFNNYNLQIMTLDSSPEKLYSGVNIEILRGYCSSYVDAMQCVWRLHNDCPADVQNEIEKIVTTVKNVGTEQDDLCRTNNLYEIYSQHMSCFNNRGPKTEWCFDTKMHADGYHVKDLSQDELCSRMKETVTCMENNIRPECGEQAAELVSLLVKPVVPGSGGCKYEVHMETTLSSTGRKDGTFSGGAPSSRSGSETQTHNASHGSNTSPSVHKNIVSNVLVFFTSFIIFFFKSRFIS